MSVDDLVQDLAQRIYQEPLSHVRDEEEFPDLANPLHMAVLLIDCDTEIDMNGILGFLENSTGRHLQKTIAALMEIGAPKCAAVLESVQECMARHNVTWERLRGDFEGATEYEVTSFRKLHGENLCSFAEQVCELTGGFSLFNSLYSPDDAYAAFLHHLGGKIEDLRRQIEKRSA